jgi:hypothetical protein
MRTFLRNQQKPIYSESLPPFEWIQLTPSYLISLRYILFPSTPRSRKWSLPFRFSDQSTCYIFISLTCATCPASLIRSFYLFFFFLLATLLLQSGRSGLLAQLPNWRTISCRSSKTAYLIYSLLPPYTGGCLPHLQLEDAPCPCGKGTIQQEMTRLGL